MVIIRPIDLAHTGQIRARNVHHMEFWNRLENTEFVNWTAVYVDTRLVLVDGLNLFLGKSDGKTRNSTFPDSMTLKL